MMWNWLTKKLVKNGQVRRKKVDIDIPYQQHSYRMEDFSIKADSEPVKQASTKFKSLN
ncbi:hypothetical protein AB4298_17255 [Shewanella sp. 10N.261.52.F9]|uniref:hypothetical protein n=1 Tax=Shewanella TaxID=22 RepID=UPI00200BD55B|nr:hypothetical protein [Shewanella marinintestina]MCL1146748.1 hypothetical protein [Shewanella marinintestina]